MELSSRLHRVVLFPPTTYANRFNIFLQQLPQNADFFSALEADARAGEGEPRHPKQEHTQYAVAFVLPSSRCFLQQLLLKDSIFFVDWWRTQVETGRAENSQQNFFSALEANARVAKRAPGTVEIFGRASLASRAPEWSL